MAKYSKKEETILPLRHVNRLLEIEDMQNLEQGELEKLGAKQGDDILLATIQFPNRVIITLNLMSGQVNYWLEWSAFINDEPLGLLFEPEFELEQKSSIRVGPDEYEIEFTNLI